MPVAKTKALEILIVFIALPVLSARAQSVTNCPAISIGDATARSSPTIFHVSDTVDVNETVQIFGDSMNSAGQQVAAMGWAIADSQVTAPQTAPAFNATGGTCLPISAASGSSAKVLLPGSSSRSGGFGPSLGLYAIQVGNTSGVSTVQFLNRAEPWWAIGTVNDSSGSIVPPIQGGTGDQLIPGQTFRVFGRNLFASNQLQGWLQGNGLTCALTYQQASSNNWSASFQLPLSCGLGAGAYTLVVHNGLGGVYGFGKTLAVTVGGIPAAWPTTVYNVKNARYGAQGNGQNDDTYAFQLALSDAKYGGIVAVPPGTYILSAKLSIPAYTVLQGTGSDQTQAVLISSENGTQSVLAGNSNFNVQNLTIQTNSARRVITCPDTSAMYNSFGLAAPFPSPACANVLVSHVTINHNTPLSAFNGSDLGNGSIHTYGSDITIQNSSITAAGTAPMLLYGTHHVVVSGNVLYNGDADADGFFSADRSIYENNAHSSTPGTYGNAVYVEGKSHYLYVAGNTIQNSVGMGGEGFVAGDNPYSPDAFGTPSAVYAGTNPSSDPPAIAFANNSWQTNQWAGEAVYVTSGKGALQRNYVASNNSNTLFLANLWTLPLDSTSVVDVVADHSEGIFYNNTFSDVSVSVDLYSQSYGFVVDNNTSSDSGGTYCLGWNHTNVSVVGPAYSVNGAYVLAAAKSSSYGPVNLRYTDASDPNGLPLIAQQYYGTARNDVTGFVGLEFTPGGSTASVSASQIYVYQLGRMCLAGNSGTHIVKLVGANGTDVPGGSASVSMAGCTPGQYVYANLAGAVGLNYTKQYFLVSQETGGGDQWYDSAPVTPSVPFNLCYFNQWSNNHVSGSLDANNPNKYGASIEFISNTAVVGPVLDPATMNSPSAPLGYIPPVTGNEVRGNTLNAVTQGSGAGSAIIGGVYNVSQPSYSCVAIPLPNGGATDTLVEGNAIYGANVPIWFWNYFGNTLIHNNVYQGTVWDFSFTTCSGSGTGGGTASAPVISGVGASATSSSSETISWTTDQASDSQVFYGTTTAYGSSSALNSASVTSHSVVLSGLSAGVQYHYYVQSRNAAGLAGDSPDAVFTVASSSSSSSSSPALITSYQAGTARNNFSGFVGMEFTTGATPISVVSLGRIYISGNTGTHIVKLVQAGTNSDVAGASVSISMSGGSSGTFTYGQLAAPVTLAANTSYLLVSQETIGGDQWYDVLPVTASSGLVTVNGPTYSTSTVYALVSGLNNLSYGPINLQYTSVTTGGGTTSGSGKALVTGQSSTTLRNNFSGWVGYALTVGSSSVQVQSLGRIFVSGNVSAHTVKLVLASTGQDVSGGSVSVSGGSAGQYTYASLPSALTLAANTSYFLVSQEVSGGDQWYDLGALSISGGATVTGPAYQNPGQGYISASIPGNGYVPVNLLYSGGASTSPPTVSVTSPASGATVSGSAVGVSASATAAAGLQIASVQFQVDGTNIGSAATTSPYSSTFNSQALSNGSHSVTAMATDSAGNSTLSAAVSITVSNTSSGGGSTSATALISGFSPGFARNDYSGWVGMEFTVGSSALSVSTLGRVYISGNTGVHTLKLVLASNGSDVAGGSVQLSLPSGTAGQFAYASLASPVTLSANTSYYLVSQETAGGDQFYNIGTVAGSGAAGILGPVYLSNSGYVLVPGLANYSYVPVSLQYGGSSSTTGTSTGSALLSGFTTGNVRNNYSGWVGFDFTVGSSAMTVTSLGRIYVSGNSGSHTVKLVQASNGADVAGASVQITFPSGTAGQFAYASLASPVTLTANTSYYLVSQETAGGDQWYDLTGVTNAGAAAIPGPVYSTGSSYVQPGGFANLAFVPVNLLHN